MYLHSTYLLLIAVQVTLSTQKMFAVKGTFSKKKAEKLLLIISPLFKYIYQKIVSDIITLNLSLSRSGSAGPDRGKVDPDPTLDFFFIFINQIYNTQICIFIGLLPIYTY